MEVSSGIKKSEFWKISIHPSDMYKTNLFFNSSFCKYFFKATLEVLDRN